MENERVIQLAIEALELQRKSVEAEIAELRAQLNGTSPRARSTGVVTATKRRAMSAAQRRAHSEAMRLYWQRRRSKASKPEAARQSATAKTGPQTAVARKAVSERMKAHWAARRKAQRAKGAQSAAARKAQSEKMKQIWAKRKTEANRATK